MTNKEAINHLTELKSIKIEFPNALQEEAIDLAIKALEDRPTGKWLEIPIKRDLLYNTGIAYTCSVCGRKNCYGKPPYCMYCGTKMIKEAENE